MKLLIRGVEYDARNIQNAAPLHMIELQQQSKAIIDGGWKISALRAADRDAKVYARARKVWEEAGADPDAEPDEPDSLWVALATMTFLTMRAGGTKISLEQAAEIPFGEMRWVPEPGDPTVDEGEGDEADPTTPGLPAPAGPETLGDVPPPLLLPAL